MTSEKKRPYETERQNQVDTCSKVSNEIYFHETQSVTREKGVLARG